MVQANGAGLSYQWYQGTSGTTTTPVGTNSASFTTPALTTATNYWVRVTNTFGTANSNTAAIAIGVGPSITTHPASQTIASGATATLTVQANGAGLSYQWYQGTSGTTTTPVGTNSASFTTPALTTATNYWVRVTNTFGTANSNTAAITIGVGPSITTHPASQTIASGATAALTVQANGAGLSYQWYQGTSGTTTTPVGTNSASFTTPALTTATNYWVRVSNTFGVANSSTATITIGAAGAGPTVQLMSPNGGERLFTGSPFLIQWNATAGAAALATFNVQYSTNNGTSFSAVPGCTNLGAAMRQCTWATPVATTTGRVRVIATDTATQSSTDDSDTTFSVVTGSPSVSVTGPSGGSTLVIGSVRAVTWTHNVGTSAFPAVFTIELSRNSTTGPWEVIAANVPQATATTGRFDWTVVGPTSSRVRFRVSSTNFTVQGTSGSNLSIANPALALFYPARSATLRIGRRATFLWLTNLGNAETVKIEVSRDAGVTWELVAASVSAGTIGTYGWTVTGPETTQMRVRLTWNRNPAVSFASSGNNRIMP